MGNAPSNRRVTVVNDDVVGIVQVSENVVRRLKGQADRPIPEKDRSAPPPQPESYPTSHSPPQPESYPTAHSLPQYQSFAPPEAFSSTLEQRQKYHDEYLKAERSWRSRINELESQNRVLFETAKENFGSTIQEVENNHIKSSYLPVCPDKEQKVLHCYKENAKYPLNCSQEVNHFLECVDKVRMTALSK